MTWAYVAPILLLLCSNVFMTFAWYGQLKFPGTALWIVVLVSWGIAFFEYCLAIPANRIGYTVYSAAQLKTMQEIITVTVFAVFSVYYLGEAIRWNHAVPLPVSSWRHSLPSIIGHRPLGPFDWNLWRFFGIRGQYLLPRKIG
jgi:uncharacterized protein (DUF486 family)